jgi:hypothetical protein
MTPRSSLAVLLLLGLAGCEIFAFADRERIPDGGVVTGGGGHGGTGGATGTTSSGSLACVLPIDCAASASPCVEATCVAGVCGTAPVAKDTPTANQAAGDCQRSVCDGAGHEIVIDDDLDVPVDGNACTDDLCAKGVPSNPWSGAGRPCATSGGKVCDGQGGCVECVSQADCGGGLACVNNACNSCLDHKKDGTETDVDCGGPSCLPCAASKACKVSSDCLSSVCSGAPAVCQAPSCGDGVRNGLETDVDCGGDCPSGCGATRGCAVDADCAGGACVANCADGERDQDETGVDCGGGCAPCGDGGGCVVAVDCQSRVCTAGACAPPAATCGNGAKDGAESDVDCGGPSCAGCAVGGACGAGADCAGGRCVAGACAELVLISEVRTRGPGGAHDEFVELYNPLGTPVTLTSRWTLSTRSAIGACETNADKVVFTGGGQVIAAHGHLLLGGSAYAQAEAADAPLAAAGVPDAGSLVLSQDAAVVDALCFAYDAATTASLASCAAPYVCKGAPAQNQPHDNTQSAASQVDASLERKPGGPLGSARDTGVSLADFRPTAPARPENAQSPPAP